MAKQKKKRSDKYEKKIVLQENVTFDDLIKVATKQNSKKDDK